MFKDRLLSPLSSYFRTIKGCAQGFVQEILSVIAFDTYFERWLKIVKNIPVPMGAHLLTIFECKRRHGRTPPKHLLLVLFLRLRFVA